MKIKSYIEGETLLMVALVLISLIACVMSVIESSTARKSAVNNCPLCGAVEGEK
jgi:hypothetical protein